MNKTDAALKKVIFYCLCAWSWVVDEGIKFLILCPGCLGSSHYGRSAFSRPQMSSFRLTVGWDAN